MANLLSRFYFLTKLTTSLILLFSLLFLGYLFLRAYLVDTNNSGAVFELTKELKFLSESVEKNSTNLELIGDIIIKNQNSFNELTSVINDLKQNKSNEELLIQIKKLFKENDILKNEIFYLSKKINSTNNQSQESQNKFPVHNLINLIKLKVESGISVDAEVDLLQNFYYSEDKISYLEKLQILSNRNFIGFSKLNKSFEKNTSEYLNSYYLETSNYSFTRYLSNIVKIQPNFNGEIKDETVRLLASTRTKLHEKDLESALNNLLLVSNNEIFFKQWIDEVNYYIEFEKALNKLLE